jgi:hypothetical protein
MRKGIVQVTRVENRNPNVSTYCIADQYTIHMRKDSGRLHGHYEDHRKDVRITFDVRGMTEKQLLNKFKRIVEKRIQNNQIWGGEYVNVK